MSYGAILKILGDVERMVQNKTWEHWNWKTSLRTRLDERNVLYELMGGLSKVALDTFPAAAKAYDNCY